MSPPIESDCEGTEKRETGEENDFKSPFKSIPLMSSSMETSLFGEVALHMPGWIRVKDKNVQEKKKYSRLFACKTSKACSHVQFSPVLFVYYRATFPDCC